MSTTITAFRLKTDTMDGSTWLDTVYLDHETAVLEGQAKNEEWKDHHVHVVQVRVLSPTEGAVGRDLVTIDRTPASEIHRRRGLAKLSKEERAVLRLNQQPTLIEAKLNLYRALLATPGDQLSEDDIDLQAALAGDVDIQKVLGAQAKPK